MDNAASRAVAERCGFSPEDVRRESHWIADRFVDHVIYWALTISLDGYGAGPDQSLDNPPGVGDHAIHEWMVGSSAIASRRL